MNLVAIALLCQVPASQAPFDYNLQYEVKCQQYYVSCWNQKRAKQLKEGKLYDAELFLSQCILERSL